VPALTSFARLAVTAASILGAVGVAAAAGATHTGDQALLGPLSLIALTQAPAILALGLYAAADRVMRGATGLIAIGALLFSADLAIRHFTGHAAFAVAAPVGGSLLILGWLTLILSAFVPRPD
jgi:uncharacterized membrane protein YgdD (TMEM256/DUF423 family)